VIDTIYIESDVVEHPRARSILGRYPQARVIECANYREVFNRRQQNFRVQKARPALILAGKKRQLLYPVPPGQNLGAPHNYYFSHLLNCPFDCRYCFLQGMFSSANYVFFVNYEDFVAEIAEVCAAHVGLVHVFSGYDCDSLALEPLTGFAAHFVEAFRGIDNAVLELRTKSTQVRSLLAGSPHEHCVVAMSLAPDIVAKRLEHGAPSLADRLNALRRLQEHGWQIGLRFDPMIPLHDNAVEYGNFFSRVFAELDAASLHSVTYGALRLPREFAKRMFRLHPDEALFAGPLVDVDGTFVFRDSVDDVSGIARDLLARHVPADKLFAQHARA
jgi:spore photoproduct lyase